MSVLLAVTVALVLSAGAVGSSERVRSPDFRIPGLTDEAAKIGADSSGVAIESGCEVWVAKGPPYQRAARVEPCSGFDQPYIEEFAYAGGRAIWTICNETNSMNCWLRTSAVKGERSTELASYCCSYAFTGFVPVGGGGLIVYRAQGSGRLMQLTPLGKAVPLALPRSLLGSRPLATDGTRIALFAHKTLYVVDRRGHVVAHWPQETVGVGATFARDRLVVDQSSSATAFLVHDLRTGTSSHVALTLPKGARWGHSLEGTSGNLVAYLAGKFGKDRYGTEVWRPTRVQLVRLPDGRTATAANLRGVSSTFGPDGLLVASGAPPNIRNIPWAKLQTLLP